MADEIEIRFCSDPRWLRPIRSFVEGFAEQVGFESGDRHDIMLAVGEALTNVMRHSYKGDCTKKVRLSCAARDGTLEIEIRDQGEAFVAQKSPPPPDELRPGGRGVYLIRAAMDEVEYQREGETNLVRMKKFRKSNAC